MPGFHAMAQRVQAHARARPAVERLHAPRQQQRRTVRRDFAQPRDHLCAGAAPSTIHDDFRHAEQRQTPQSSGAVSNVMLTSIVRPLIGRRDRPARTDTTCRMPRRDADRAATRFTTAGPRVAPATRCPTRYRLARFEFSRLRASCRSTRPGHVDERGAVCSCIHTRSFGTSSTPRSRPFSQWSHQRTASCRKPIAGPGRPDIRILMRPRTDDAAARHVETVQHTNHRVRVSVRPAADHQHRATNRRIVLADRAVAPIRVALRMCHPAYR